MDTVELYTFEDTQGTPDTYTTFNPIEAKEYGQRWNRKVIAQRFEYSDSELVWDFTT